MNNITPGHVNAFQAIRSQLYSNITLISCTINDEPGVAIVMMDMVAEDKMAVMPLFVALTPGMKIDFPRGEESEDSDGGGPQNPKEQFKANKDSAMQHWRNRHG